MVIDPAGTSQEVAAVARGREPSYTAIVVLDMVPRTNELIVVDVVRFRAEFPEVCLRIQETRTKHRPAYVAIEDTSIGRAIIPMFNRIGLTVKPLLPGTQDKLTRAAEAMVRAEQGKIFLPAVATWRDNFLAELVQWTGHPDEPFDQGDCLAYAAKIAAETADNQQQNFVPWGIGRIGG
jgi:predicted phage terminase large subunit-like protein